MCTAALAAGLLALGLACVKALQGRVPILQVCFCRRARGPPVKARPCCCPGSVQRRR